MEIEDILQDTNKELVAIKDALRNIAEAMGSIAVNGVNNFPQEGEE